MRKAREWQAFVFAILLGAGLIVPRAGAQIRPEAARLFPENTAAFLSIPNVADAKKAFFQSALGRMASDPELRPFLTDFWGRLVKATEQFEKETGVSLAAAFAIPEGEVSLGLVASETSGWVALLLVDAGQNVETLQKLMDFACTAAAKAGGKVETENVGQATLRIIVPPEPDTPRLAFAILESRLFGEVVFQGDENFQVLKQVLQRAQGTGANGAVLGDSKKFEQLLSNIRYANRGQIHAILFADPIEIIRGTRSWNPSTAVVLAILPVLGLDGLNSLGAAASLDVSGWDSIREFHLFLDNPRRGVLDVPAFKSGDGIPEFFIPESVSVYMTVYIDLPTTIQRVGKIYDGFRGDGAFERQAGMWVKNRLGLDLFSEVLPVTAGRISYVQWVERPVRINSATTAIVVELKDPETAQQMVTIISESVNGSERQEFGKYVYYQVKRNLPESFSEEQFRVPTPCFAAIDRYLVATDSVAFLQEMFTTAETPEKALAQSLEYKLVRGRIKSLAGNDPPAMFYFDRPDATVELWYEGLFSEGSFFRRSFTEDLENAPKDPIGSALAGALKEGKLPPVKVLKRYFAPRGGLLIDDATGLHFTMFALRKKLP